jgi:hypothetical protein
MEAIPEKMKIRIEVPLEFIAVEQTSASTFNCRYSYTEHTVNSFLRQVYDSED